MWSSFLYSLCCGDIRGSGREPRLQGRDGQVPGENTPPAPRTGTQSSLDVKLTGVRGQVRSWGGVEGADGGKGLKRRVRLKPGAQRSFSQASAGHRAVTKGCKQDQGRVRPHSGQGTGAHTHTHTHTSSRMETRQHNPGCGVQKEILLQHETAGQDAQNCPRTALGPELVPSRAGLC